MSTAHSSLTRGAELRPPDISNVRQDVIQPELLVPNMWSAEHPVKLHQPSLAGEGTIAPTGGQPQLGCLHACTAALLPHRGIQGSPHRLLSRAGSVQAASGQRQVRRSGLIPVHLGCVQRPLHHLHPRHPLLHQSGVLELLRRHSVGKPLRVFHSLIE